jgi:glycosyltransferase involved in cell wall biosynthesis
MHVAIVGTYPPTRCGIATFTADVEAALRSNDTDVTVVPVGRGEPDAPIGIERDERPSYARAAGQLNELQCDVVLVQHEFGIFGGPSGSHLLDLVERLDMPYVVTLHTVLPRFSDHESALIAALCRNAAAVTVFSSTARRLLLEQELVPASAVQVVAHGAPAELYDYRDRSTARTRLGIPHDGPVMATFGLLSDGKGIEVAIRALAELADRHPGLQYVVAGRTHPEVIARDGERYRQMLHELAAEMGVAERVIFLDRFLDLSELADLLAVSDLVCTPYRGQDQIVSGVLTFALAAGCPVVSTPYRYARDVLADGAGLLVPFGDHAAFAEAIDCLLDEHAGSTARLAARQASAQMPWPTVGRALRTVLSQVRTRQPVPPHERAGEVPPAEPDVLGTAHLRLLCDDTSILQHAFFGTPRVEDGYCVDDAGRALPLVAGLAAGTGDPAWHACTGRLMAYLRAASLGGGGLMRNFMSWDRHWLDEPYLGDHLGRAIWGLGEVIATDGAFSEDARELLQVLGPAVLPTWPTRTVAYAALGLVAAGEVDDARNGDLERILPALRRWTPSTDPGWRWFEPRLTYDNARIPEVLMRVGEHIGDRRLTDRGLVLLDWLDSVCRHDGQYRFPGHRGLASVRELRWSGDEQPLEATATADAHLAAAVITGDRAHLARVDLAWTWFLGNNRLGEPLVEATSGAGFDGLGANGVNRNRGAESTIAAHRCAATTAAARRLAPGILRTADRHSPTASLR